MQDVMAAVFTLSPTATAEACGVGIAAVLAWRDGTEPVPVACFRLLQFMTSGVVPAGFGRWSGWQFTEDRFNPPGDKNGPRLEELLFIDHYRLNQHLVVQQHELIDQLIRQRDFYSRQCALEARTGLMLANLCGNN